MAELLRVTVALDGRTKANFSDNSMLLLNQTGSAFIHCTEDGKQTRQLSEYVLTRHSSQLAVVLEFRNMHLDEPFFCRPLLRNPRPGVSLGYIIRDAWWPVDAADAVGRGLVQAFPDGRVAVSTEDELARIILHAHRRRFAVCYPLLVGERPQESKYDYVWHTQVFSVQGCPARWQSAADLVLAAAELLQQQQQGSLQLGPPCGHSGMAVHGSSAHVHEPAPPCHDACPAEHRPSESSSGGALVLHASGAGKGPRTELPAAVDRGLGGICDGFKPGSWWFEHTLTLFPPEEVIVMEWTQDALYQFHPGSCEVEACIHRDESNLCTVKQGRYLLHCKGCAIPAPDASGLVPPAADAAAGALPGVGVGAPQEQLYAATCVPEVVWSRDGRERYNLGQVAAHALKFREQMAAAVASQRQQQLARRTGGASGAAIAPGHLGPQHHHHQQHHRSSSGSHADASFAVADERVVEQSCVPGQGTFTAFADGRARAMFEDRAIVHVNAAHTHCKVFLPDGACVMVAASNPVGVEPYVQATFEFITWAFKSPAQRMHEAQARARAEAEAASARRMAQLCEYFTSGKVPKELMHDEGLDVPWGSSTTSSQGLQPKLLTLTAQPSCAADDVAAARLWSTDQGSLHGSGQGQGAGRGMPDSACASARQQMIESMLERNAALLRRL